MLVLLFVLLFASPVLGADPCPNGAPLAFAGAEGFGRCSQGGRGGRTIDVTNLNNAGPGSLRQCAEVESGPRNCIIKVSGTISLIPVAGPSADIVIKNSFVTIDGTTAPGGGIALKDGGITTMGSHIIVRNIRIRPGLKSFIVFGSNANGITVMSDGDIRGTDLMFANISISWTSDDAVNVVFGADKITFQDLLISDSVGPNDPRGKHFLMAYGAWSVSFIRNLGAHGWGRWPEFSGGGSSPGQIGYLDLVNNVLYNDNGQSTQMAMAHGPGFMNAEGNYYKEGLDVVPANVRGSVTLSASSFSTSSGAFVRNNYGRYGCGGGIWCLGIAVPDGKIINNDGWNGALPLVPYNFPRPTTIMDPVTAYTYVLDHAGAFPRDSYDTRIINEVRTKTGRRMQDPRTQIGPWPVLVGGTVPPLDTDGDGFPDSSDSCPTVFGVAPNGCPVIPPPPVDTDGDGFVDTVDLCPTVPGVAPNGCPVVPPVTISKTITITKETTVQHTDKLILEVLKTNCPGGSTTTSKTYNAAGVVVPASDPTWAKKLITVTCK